MPQLTQAKLRKWNIGVGIFQLITSTILFVITDYDLTTPWYTFFILERDGGKPGYFVPNIKSAVTFPVGLASAVFLLLSAIDHLAVSLPGLNSIYNRNLGRGLNYFRWIEYSVSAAVMRCQIAMLSGVTDIHLLFAIFGLTTCTMLFGWLMEDTNGHRLMHGAETSADGFITNGQQKMVPSSGIDWKPFVMGFIPHAAAWSIIVCYFFQGVINGDPPGFVWVIIFVLFFLDLTFAVVQFLQFKQVKGFRGWGQAEFAYIILSITAKQLLAWIQFGGSRSLEAE